MKMKETPRSLTGLQHAVPRPGALPQLCGLRGPRREDAERRRRVGQLAHPRIPELPEEADDRGLMKTLQPFLPQLDLIAETPLVSKLSFKRS